METKVSNEASSNLNGILAETSNLRRNQSAKEKLKFNDTIIEITNDNECKINELNNDRHTEFNDVDGTDITESEFPIRDEIETNDELLKRRIYRQALAINQSSIASPKFQRIHEGVSRVFGLDDPPPGFGLIYPKYYYLEQKRPQPMSPLKVWRGFNGNIYFEPIQLKNIDINSNDYTRHYSLNPTSNKAATKSEIIDTFSEHLTTSSKYIDYHKDDTTTNASDLDNQQIKVDVQTKRDTTTLLLAEASEILLANTISKRSQTFFQVNTNRTSELDNDLDTMSSTSVNAARKQTKLNSLILKRNEPLNTTINSNNTNSVNKYDHSKLRISINENPQRILPNLAAVKRHNAPLRGLAYREAKQRINSSNDFELDQFHPHPHQHQAQPQPQPMPISNYDYFHSKHNNKATPEELFRQTNSTANSSYLRVDSPQKLNYRDMLKGIRKGVTLNLGTSTNANHSNMLNTLRKEDLTTNEDFSSKKQSLKENLNPKLVDSKKSKTSALITHRNFKILNIKGDRISNIDILVTKPANNNEILNPNPSNSVMTSTTTTNANLASSTPTSSHNVTSSSNHNILTDKSRSEINPNKINKIVIKAKITSPSMMSMKSSISLVNIHPANRRTNPSPEMT